MEREYTRIILADDDIDDRLFFTDAFAELKINTRVETFNDGVELMNYLLSEEAILPQILFLDLNMPRKNGMDCLREIKENPKFNNMAIAIYSTSSSEQHIEETFILGANIYIKKPNDFSALKKALSEVVTMSWQYDTSGMNKDNFLLRI